MPTTVVGVVDEISHHPEYVKGFKVDTLEQHHLKNVFSSPYLLT